MFRWSTSEHTNLEQRPQPESSVTVVHRSRCRRTPVPARPRPCATQCDNDRALMTAAAPPSRNSCGLRRVDRRPGKRPGNGWATVEQMVRAHFVTGRLLRRGGGTAGERSAGSTGALGRDVLPPHLAVDRRYLGGGVVEGLDQPRPDDGAGLAGHQECRTADVADVGQRAECDRQHGVNALSPPRPLRPQRQSARLPRRPDERRYNRNHRPRSHLRRCPSTRGTRTRQVMGILPGGHAQPGELIEAALVRANAENSDRRQGCRHGRIGRVCGGLSRLPSARDCGSCCCSPAQGWAKVRHRCEWREVTEVPHGPQPL